MKRAALVVVALLVLVALGAGAAYYLHLKHASRDVLVNLGPDWPEGCEGFARVVELVG